MAEDRVQRKLAAILAADVAGYSRLMGRDEEGTLAVLTAHLTELIEPCIAEHRGRVVKTTGDGLLAEFASVVDAVRCAVAFQEGMAKRNGDTPGDRRIEFRIGVNLGDVIVQGDDVFGDGVNVAARMEGLAEPGSVVVSGTVHEHVRGKLDFDFDDLGSQEVKNIAEPVRTYRARIRGGASTSPTASTREEGPLPHPDKPSIAVLPFENMSGDPEQQYFSDGLSEDIITDLSKIPGLFVIARNSSFVYRGKSVSVQAVSKELGVRHVLEGSVRRAGNRVRVSAQLIDGDTEGHLWAERYDRDFSDIFAVQDEIVGEIVSALAASLSSDKAMRAASSTTDNMEAYDLFLRGRDLVWQQTREANERSKPVLEHATELSPNFAPAYSMLAAPLIREYVNGWAEHPETSLARAHEIAQHAVALDDLLPQAHWTLGITLMWMKQLDSAAREVERAIKLDPNFADAFAAVGQIHTYAGRPADGIEPLRMAMRLDPHYRDVFLHFLGQARFMCGQFDESVELLQRRLVRKPDTDITRVLLSASYGHLGLIEQAREQWSEVLKVNPSYSLEHRRSVLPFKDPADFEKIANGLRKAGLLEDQEANQVTPLSLPDKPSIAVLPFENMSGDPEQEYFADGISEDIITALGRVRQFFVVARNTTFTYKGQSVDVQAVARELGVRYVLEGSVRKAGNRVRITAQLIDGATGNHLWAERYDRELDDIFELQDELSMTLAAAIGPALSNAELQRAQLKKPDSLNAWDLYQRGLWNLNRRNSDDIIEAARLFDQAMEMDPNFGPAFAGYAWAYRSDVIHGSGKLDAQKAKAAALRAVSLDREDPYARFALGNIHTTEHNFEAALEEFQAALALNPSFADAYQRLAFILVSLGRPQEALDQLNTCIRLSPQDVVIGICYTGYCLAHLSMHHYTEAIEWGRKALRQPMVPWVPYAFLIVALAHSGDVEEARAVVEELRSIRPDLSISHVRDRIVFVDEKMTEHLLDGLRKAGLPEGD